MPREPAAPRRVLVVSLRFLGDLLISTLIADGVKRRWPDCQVDYLVYEGMEGVLQGNTCVDRVLTLPPRAKPQLRLAMVRQVWRRYDLALTTHSGDYPHLVLWAAAPERVGALPLRAAHAWWKRWLAPRSVAEMPGAPIAALCARIAEAAGVQGLLQMRPPQAAMLWAPVQALQETGQPYAVLNPSPRWTYKRWHAAGWRALVAQLQAAGLAVVVTGSQAAEEQAYLDSLFEGCTGLLRADASVDFAQAGSVIASARLFVGPDTFTTHLAASCGVPTVTLFGPTDPRIWGPISQALAGEGAVVQGFVAAERVQRRANVWLLQNPEPACMPCQQEGCERHRQSHSRCLDELPTSQVLAVVETILQSQALRPA